MPVKTLVATPDREPSRASTIAHAATINAASGGLATVTVPVGVPAANAVEQAASAAISRDLIDAAGTDSGKLRQLALTLLDVAELAQRRQAAAEHDAGRWERQALDASTEADAVMFRQSQVDRAGDLIHAAHDRFPWRMCTEEPCRLLQEATGRSISTN
jgi:hypothetical protein